jgi:hemoglobin
MSRSPLEFKPRCSAAPITGCVSSGPRPTGRETARPFHRVFTCFRSDSTRTNLNSTHYHSARDCGLRSRSSPCESTRPYSRARRRVRYQQPQPPCPDDPTIVVVATPPTLYEWAGGSEAFSRMISAFYDRVEQDDLLSPFFPGGAHEDHRRHVAVWWGEVFGGPAQYTAELGGYERMLSKHLDLGITEQQRFRFTELMRLAADEAGIPNDPEFRSALVAYLEWGTRIALGNSQRDAKVMEHAIGGGSILAPILIGAGWSPKDVAPATLASTFVTSVAGVITFLILASIHGGSVAPDWGVGLALGAGGIIGGYCGARLQPRLPEDTIRRLLAGIVTTIGLRYAWLVSER